MLKRIYSKSKETVLILDNGKEYSLKELLYLFAIEGSKLTWKNQKRRFKVIARNDNFIIIARPYNPQRTFEYSILDLETMQCNRDNMIFGPKYDYSNKEECLEAIKELQETKDNDLCDGLQLSQRGIDYIEDAITEIWVEVERIKNR